MNNFDVFTSACVENNVEKVREHINKPSIKENINTNFPFKDMQDIYKNTELEINKRNVFHLACYLSRVEIVDILLNSGAKPDVACSDGHLPVHYACASTVDAEAKVRKLISLDKACANAESKECVTPIFYAARYGQYSVVRLLATENSVRTDQLHDKDTLLHTVCRGKIDVYEKVKFLLDTEPQLVNNRDDEGYTALGCACCVNTYDIVKLLLERGADANIANHRGFLPIHEACLNPDHGPKIAEALLNIDSSFVNRLDNDGRPPLWKAACGGNQKLMELLIARGAEINVTRGRPPLHGACRADSLEPVQLLLQKGADAGIKYDDGSLPIHQACNNENHEVAVQIADILLNLDGSFVNREDGMELTPIHYAASTSNMKLAKLLLVRGAHVNFKGHKQPVHGACYSATPELVQLLVENGADINLKDQSGRLPIHRACFNTNNGAQIAKYLLNINESAVNCLDNDGRPPLGFAASHCNRELMELLIARGAEINVTSGRPPIHGACHADSTEAILLLLEKGADAGSRYAGDGTSPIHEACRSEHHEAAVQIAEILLNIDSNCVNCCDDDQWTPLCYAAGESNIKLAKFLLEKGAQVNFQDAYQPLHVACAKATLELVKLLVENGAEVNFKEDDGSLPLHEACANAKNGAQIAEFLLDITDSSVNSVNEDGKTPLGIASTENNLELAKILLTRGAKVNVTDGLQPLHAACTYASPDVVQLLVENGADVNIKHTDGTLPIHAACTTIDDEVEKVEILLNSDSSCVNKTNDNDETPLWLAAFDDKLELAKVLIARGAEANSEIGRPALHAACFMGSPEVVKLLLDNRADANKIDTDGCLPFHTARYNFEHGVQIVEMLLYVDSGFVNRPNDDGDSPLWLAASESNIKLMQLLLARGAHVNVENNSQPLHVACEKAKPEAVQLLVASGADVNAMDSDGYAPIHLCDGNDDDFKKKIDILLEAGVEINAVFNDKLPALHDTVLDEKYAHSLVLLERGADPTIQDNDRLTAFDYLSAPKPPEYVDEEEDAESKTEDLAETQSTKEPSKDEPITEKQESDYNKHVEVFFKLLPLLPSTTKQRTQKLLEFARFCRSDVLKRLLQHGFDVKEVESSGFSTLLVVSSELWDATECVNVCLLWGSDVNFQDDDGKTALHNATINNKVDTVRLLTSHADIDISLQNNNGETALAFSETVELSSLLREATSGSQKYMERLVKRLVEENTYLQNEISEVRREASAPTPEKVVKTHDSEKSIDKTKQGIDERTKLQAALETTIKLEPGVSLLKHKIQQLQQSVDTKSVTVEEVKVRAKQLHSENQKLINQVHDVQRMLKNRFDVANSRTLNGARTNDSNIASIALDLSADGGLSDAALPAESFAVKPAMQTPHAAKISDVQHLPESVQPGNSQAQKSMQPSGDPRESPSQLPGKTQTEQSRKKKSSFCTVL